jgi:hypothetical protein
MNFSDSNEIISPSMDQSVSERFLSSDEPKMTEAAGLPTEVFLYTEDITWKDTEHLSLSSTLASVDVGEPTSISKKLSLKQSISKPILSKDATLSVSYMKTDWSQAQSLPEGHTNKASSPQSHGGIPVSPLKSGHESISDVNLLSPKFSSAAHRSFSSSSSSRNVVSVDVSEPTSIKKKLSLKQSISKPILSKDATLSVSSAAHRSFSSSLSSRNVGSIHVGELTSSSNYLPSRHDDVIEGSIDLSVDGTLAASHGKKHTGEDTITYQSDSLSGNATLEQVSGSNESETYSESDEKEPLGGSGDDAVKMEKRESTSVTLITVTVIAMLIFCVTEFYLLTREDKYAFQQDKNAITSDSGST